MIQKITRISFQNCTEGEFGGIINYLKRTYKEVEFHHNTNTLKKGNFVSGHLWINGVPEQIATEIRDFYNNNPSKFSCKIDYVKSLITPEDIRALTIGDKVTVELEGHLGQPCRSKGTVVAVGEDYAILLKRWCKRMRIEVFCYQIGMIEKYWDD
jgi:hypothetical protein